MSGDQLVVDWTRCRAHGACAQAFPEVISLDRWGYPIVGEVRGAAGRSGPGAPGEVPEHLAAHARRAVAACPEVAVRVLRRPART